MEEPDSIDVAEPVGSTEFLEGSLSSRGEGDFSFNAVVLSVVTEESVGGSFDISRSLVCASSFFGSPAAIGLLLVGLFSKRLASLILDPRIS